MWVFGTLPMKEWFDEFLLTDGNLPSVSEGETENFVPTTLDYAATASRLPAAALSQLEKYLFPDLVDKGLKVFHRSSNKKLTVLDVYIMDGSIIGEVTTAENHTLGNGLPKGPRWGHWNIRRICRKKD